MMSRFVRLCLVLLFLLTLAGSTSAQAPEPAPVEVDLSATTPGFHRESPWTSDILLGLPAGVRVQYALDEHHRWLLEGFGGVTVILPTAGVGLRRRCTPWCNETRAITIAPGVGVYGVVDPLWGGGGVGLAAADVDLTWGRRGSNGRVSEIGIKLGAVRSLSGGMEVAPFGGLFLGWSR